METASEKTKRIEAEILASDHDKVLGEIYTKDLTVWSRRDLEILYIESQELAYRNQVRFFKLRDDIRNSWLPTWVKNRLLDY